MAPGRGSAQEAGRPALPVECVWALEGTGRVGQRGELEVPVRWLSEPGVGVCQGWGGRALCCLPGSKPQLVRACVCVCVCVCACALVFWDTQALSTLHILPSTSSWSLLGLKDMEH
jgi:hypothetical protein